MSLGASAHTGSAELPPVPEPRFTALGARTVRHAAAPMLALDLEVAEPTGRKVYMIALTVALMLEPARRTYTDAERGRLVELFGAPERWAVTTRSLVWTRADVLVPSFTGATTVTLSIPCSYDLELAAAKYLYALGDGVAPLALHFTGTIYYRDDAGALQMVLVPWNTSIDYRMPVAVWRETVEHYYPGTAWLAVRQATLDALQQQKLRRGLATFDDCLRALLAEAGDG
ncbi:MAG TPA: DUF6084 family protein [Solirubrobacteraceae bacterium]|nr:DUF6084 family protein [Solirubrobacteraceae bacterium]